MEIFKCDYCRHNPYFVEELGMVDETHQGEWNRLQCQDYVKSPGRDETLERLKDPVYDIKYNSKILNVVEASEKVLFKDLCKVHNIPAAVVNKMTTNKAVGDALEEHDTERLVQMMTLIDPQAEIIFAQALQEIDYVYDCAGMVYGASVHASGVVISEDPINMPISEGACHANGKYVELLGYIKFDMLGLSSLDPIELMQGMDVDWDDVPADAFKYVHEGPLDFVFQFGSPVVDNMVHGVGEEEITVLGLSDVTSCNRPGPLDAGLDKSWIDVKNQNIPFIAETTALLQDLREKGKLKI